MTRPRSTALIAGASVAVQRTVTSTVVDPADLRQSVAVGFVAAVHQRKPRSLLAQLLRRPGRARPLNIRSGFDGRLFHPGLFIRRRWLLDVGRGGLRRYVGFGIAAHLVSRGRVCRLLTLPDDRRLVRPFAFGRLSNSDTCRQQREHHDGYQLHRYYPIRSGRSQQPAVAIVRSGTRTSRMESSVVGICIHVTIFPPHSHSSRLTTPTARGGRARRASARWRSSRTPRTGCSSPESEGWRPKPTTRTRTTPQSPLRCGERIARRWRR